MISRKILFMGLTVCLAVSVTGAAVAMGANASSAEGLPSCTAPFSLSAWAEEGSAEASAGRYAASSGPSRVDKGEISVSVQMDGWVYDGTSHFPTVSVKSPSAYSVGFYYESTDDRGYSATAAPAEAGDYRLTVTVTVLEDECVAQADFSVTARTLTLSAGGDAIYDGRDHALGFTLDGFAHGEEIGQDAVTVEGEARLAGEYRYVSAGEPAGERTIAVALGARKGKFDPVNYRLEIADGQFRIKKATVTVGGFFVQTRTYKGSAFEDTYTIGENDELDPRLSEDPLTVSELSFVYDNGEAVRTALSMTLRTSSKEAGTYSLNGEHALYVEFVPKDGDNFVAVIDEEEGSAVFMMEISPIQLHLKAGGDLVYDGKDHSDHFRVSGFVAGEEPDGAIVDIEGRAENAGTYRYVPFGPERENDLVVSLKDEVQGAFDPQNYEIVDIPDSDGIFTVQKCPLSLILETASLQYTGKGMGVQLSVRGVKGEIFGGADYTLFYRASAQRGALEAGTGLPLTPGSYTVTAAPVAGGAADRNYCAGSASFEIVPGDMAVACAMESRTYDGTPPVPEITVNGGEPFEGLSVSCSYTDAEGNDLSAPPVDAGSYLLTVTVTDGKGNFRTFHSQPVAFEIFPRKLTLTAGGDCVYDLTDHGRNFTVTGFLAGEEAGGDAIAVGGTAKNAGKYRYASEGGGEDVLFVALVTEDLLTNGKRFHPANYELTVSAESSTFFVLPAEAEINFPEFSEGGFTAAYNGTDRYAELCAVHIEGVAGEEVPCSVRVLRGDTACTEAKNAGEYTVMVTVDDPNYVLKGEAVQTFEIRRALLLLSGVSARDKRYDGTDIAEVTQGALVYADATGEEVRYSLEARFMQTDASAEPVRVTVSVSSLLANGKDGRENYVLLFETEEGQFADELSVWAHIEAARITLSEPLSRVYTGEDLYRAIAEEIVPVNLDHAEILPHIEVSRQTMSDAGNYALEVTIAPEDWNNFEFSEGGTQTVLHARIEAAEIVGVVWRVGGAEAEERYPYLGAEGYTVMAEGTWYPANDPARGAITQKLALLLDGAPSDGGFSRYREEGYLFTATVRSNNFVLAPALSLQRKLFVAKRQLTVTKEQVTAEGKVYDGTTAAKVAFSGAAEGVAEGDDVSVRASGVFESARAGSNRVEITLSLMGNDADNYELSENTFSSDAVIAKRKLTLFGLCVLPKQYDGESTASLAYTGTDALSGDDVRIGIEARYSGKDVCAEETVGIAAVRLYGEDADCYTAEYLLGEQLTGRIDPAELSVVPLGAADRVYNGSDRVEVLLRLEESGIVRGDDVKLRSTTVQGRAICAEAGRQQVILEGAVSLAGSSAGNYVAVLADEPLSVNILRAEIAVTCFVSETHIVYGESAPVLVMTYSGFVNGEKEDAITPAVYLSDYDNADPAKRGRGRYSYFLSTEASAANYTFVYLDEALSFEVEPRPLTVKWEGLALVFDGSTQAPSATAAGTVYGEEVTLGVEGGGKDAGVYRATAFLRSANENYFLENGNAEFVIAKATPTISAEALRFVYDGAAHRADPQVPAWVEQVEITYNGQAEAPVDAGEYQTVIAVPESNNYLGAHITVRLTIEPKPISVNWDGGGAFAADGEVHTPFLGLSGGAEAEVVYSTADGALLAGVPSAPGEYKVTVRLADENNYRLEGETEKTFVIEAKQSAVRWILPAVIFFVLAPAIVFVSKRRKRR